MGGCVGVVWWVLPPLQDSFVSLVFARRMCGSLPQLGPVAVWLAILAEVEAGVALVVAWVWMVAFVVVVVVLVVAVAVVAAILMMAAVMVAAI